MTDLVGRYLDYRRHHGVFISAALAPKTEVVLFAAIVAGIIIGAFL